MKNPFNKYDYIILIVAFLSGILISNLYGFVWWKHLLLTMPLALIYLLAYKSGQQDKKR